MLFDSWGGVLDLPRYQQFSLKWMQKIIQKVKSKYDIPIIIFTKGGGLYLNEQANISPDCIGLDWSMDIAKACEILNQNNNNNIAIQGNLDPATLFA